MEVIAPEFAEETDAEDAVELARRITQMLRRAIPRPRPADQGLPVIDRERITSEAGSLG